MKKIIFIIATVAITAAGLLYEPTVKNETNNDITFENAEAMAVKTAEKEPYACSYGGRCYMDGHYWNYKGLFGEQL